MAKDIEYFDHVCRLCMSSEFLINLFKTGGDTSLENVIESFINLKMYPGDGLPEKICMSCKNTIEDYYKFKQKCLEVDKKLRVIIKCKQIEEHISNATCVTAVLNKYNKNICTTAVAQEYLHDSLFSSKYYVENEDIIHNSYTPKADVTNKSYAKSKQCEICGEIFTTKSALTDHLSTHTSTRRFQCNVCSKSFSRSESYVIHTRSHLGIKPFICEICGRSSTKKQDLIRHLRIHSDEKKFSCLTCGRKFKRSSDIPSHMRTHTGVRPYQCQGCNKSYTSHSGLRKHLKTSCVV